MALVPGPINSKLETGCLAEQKEQCSWSPIWLWAIVLPLSTIVTSLSVTLPSASGILYNRYFLPQKHAIHIRDYCDTRGQKPIKSAGIPYRNYTKCKWGASVRDVAGHSSLHWAYFWGLLAQWSPSDIWEEVPTSIHPAWHTISECRMHFRITVFKSAYTLVMMANISGCWFIQCSKEPSLSHPLECLVDQEMGY